MPNLERPTGQEKRSIALSDVAVATETADFIGFRGHAAVFDRPTWIGPQKLGFHEVVARGAFTRAIKNGADVRFLINHDPSLLLARSTAGTLRLNEDTVGLAVDADLARTSYGDDLAILLARGDVSEMSFAFQATQEDWSVRDDGSEQRTIQEAQLFDVSAVTYPAYEGTKAQLRAQAFDVLADRLGLSTTKRARIIGALADDDPEAFVLLRDVSTNLASFLERTDPATATPPPEDQNPDPATATRGVHPSKDLRRLRHQSLERIYQL